MEVKIEKENEKIIVTISGHLDTITAGELEQQAIPLLEYNKHIVFECRELSYISSSGLRIILSVHKKLLDNKGELLLRNVSPEILSILNMTGLNTILNIER